jgi:hypothetical protein
MYHGEDRPAQAADYLVRPLRLQQKPYSPVAMRRAQALSTDINIATFWFVESVCQPCTGMGKLDVGAVLRDTGLVASAIRFEEPVIQPSVIARFPRCRRIRVIAEYARQ